MTASRTKLTLCEAACDYAERGLFVLPAKRDKAPLIAGGFNSASNDPDQLLRWWSRWPEANIGIACDASDLVVIDVDERSDGFVTLDELELKCELPKTPCSQTGGDGLHAFFRYPGVPLKGRLPGIDIKHHGYVIAPPSIHQSGKRYEWIIDFDQPLRSLPGPWLEILSRANKPLITNIDNTWNNKCGPRGETDFDWLKDAEALGDWGEKDVDWLRPSP